MSDPTAHLWSRDLERAVLGVVLDGRHATAWATLAAVCPHPGVFYAREHQLLAVVLFQLAAAGEALDATTVATAASRLKYADAAEAMRLMRVQAEAGHDDAAAWSRAKPMSGEHAVWEDSLLAAIGGFNGVTDLAQCGLASGHARNCARLAEHYRQRRLLAALEAAADRLRAPAGASAVDAVGGDLINTTAKVLGQAVGDQDLGDAVAEALAQHDAAGASGGAARASWGLPTLDRMLPLTGDAFVVLAAPSGGGKTSLALQAIAASAVEPDSVAVVSREMSGSELARVLIARQLGIPATAVRDGTLTRDEAALVADLGREWKERGAVSIQAHTERVSVDDIAAWVRLRATRSGGRLRLVVIDYLQLLDPTNPRQTDLQKLSEATRRLKLLQGALRVPILLLSQFNRDGTRASRSASGDLGLPPEPQLADLRGSGTIEQDANAVVMLWPRTHPGDGPTQQVTVKVAKNRAGPVGLIPCDFHRARGQVFVEALTAPGDRHERLEAKPSTSEDLFK